MSDGTAIEWADATWSPLLGCSKVSAGCHHCYAILQAWIKQHNPNPKVRAAYEGLVEKRSDRSLNWTGRVNLIPERLELPLRWDKPRRIFVNSLSDLFHEAVPDEFIDRVFAVMAWTPQHTYQLLTKRPERMATYLTAPDVVDRIANAMCGICMSADGRLCGFPGDDCGLHVFDLPLLNVWLGTSVEDQRAADERIPHLLKTPAAVRFLSCEPLLGPVDLTSVHYGDHALDVLRYRYRPWLTRQIPHDLLMSFGLASLGKIDWVIVGGESGPRHRPMDADWARSLRDQCAAAGVDFFFKQHGGRTPKAGGRLLDGRTWDEFPAPRVAAPA